jgi:endoglucanase
MNLSHAEASKQYLTEYPDVRAAGMDPWDHYIRHGASEGRTWKGEGMSFVQACKLYLDDNSDVKAAGMDPWDHYTRHGSGEGRLWKGLPIFKIPHNVSQNGNKTEGYTAKNGKIYKGDKEVKINGINWFGMNTGTYCVHSLWSTSLDEYISILKRSGFNAVRLVLSAKVMLNLDALIVNSVDETLNSGLKGKTAGQHLDDLIDRLGTAGILVMLNLHRMTGEGDNAEDIGPYWYSDAYPETKIIDAWVTIAKRYASKDNVFAMDIKNEPHGASWGTNDVMTDFAAFCERVGNAIIEVNPRVLIGVAGVTKCVWSDNVGPAVRRPVTLSVGDKVFYTPHFYNVYRWWPNVDFKAYMDECVGDVVRAGMPVIVGEWGYNESDELDMRWLADFTAYMNALGVTNCMYWALNENASENHGILAPGSANVKQFKIDAIQRLTPIIF